MQDAISLLEEAYPASRKIRGADSIADQLLHAYTKAAKSDEIAKLVPELLASARTELPKNGKQIASVLSSCGRGFLALKAWTDAEPVLRECLTIREKLEADDWRTFNTSSMLGGSLLGQEKFAEAEPLLISGYEGMKLREEKIPAVGRPRLTESIERLVELYTAWQKPEQAKEWSTRLEEQVKLLKSKSVDAGVPPK